MAKIKGAFAKIAYAAGVSQIVDTSSFTVNFPYRSGYINTIHRKSEEAILAEKPDDKFYVALRPGRFFTTHIWLNAQTIKTRQSLIFKKISFLPPILQSWHLTEPVEKHANCVYTLIDETLSTNERAAIFSEAIGKPVMGKEVPMKGMYDHIISVGFPHAIAIDLIQSRPADGATPYFTVILGRPAQTFREWLQEDKNFEKSK